MLSSDRDAATSASIIWRSFRVSVDELNGISTRLNCAIR